MKIPLKMFLLSLASISIFLVTPVLAQDEPTTPPATAEEKTILDDTFDSTMLVPEFRFDFSVGIVTSVGAAERMADPTQDFFRQSVEVRLGEGEVVTIDNDYFEERDQLKPGDKIVVVATTGPDGTAYALADRYRLPAVGMISALFLLVVFLFARKKGLMAVLGLVFSLVVVMRILIPWILAGANPLMVSLVSATMIAFVSLYLAHGFTKQTTIALGATILSLVLSLGLALLFVSLTQLSGQGTEEAFYLQVSNLQAINLRGLLLGGIIIGTLGVLDDITTAQVAVVDQLRHANAELTVQELYHRGLIVGKEHIASLVNTLVLAYVGVALPLLLLVITNTHQPLWVSFNSQYIIEEAVRALVGSATLVLAVPIATLLAARFLSPKNIGKISHQE